MGRLNNKITIFVVLLVALLITPAAFAFLGDDSIWRGTESGYNWNSRHDGGTGNLCPENRCSTDSSCIDAGEPYVGNVPFGGNSASWVCADSTTASSGVALYRCGINNGWPNNVGDVLNDWETDNGWCCTNYGYGGVPYVFSEVGWAGSCNELDCNGDYEFDVDLTVLCTSPRHDQASLNVPIAGDYDVEGVVLRSIPPQLQSNEKFTVSANGDTGPVVPDNGNPYEIVRVQNAGNLPFSSGNNVLSMDHAKTGGCANAESVTVTKICLTRTSTPDCSTNSDCNDGNVCTADVCVNAGDADAYCSNTPEPQGTTCADDGDVCTDDYCDGAGVCVHPGDLCVCESDADCPSSQNECKTAECFNPGTPQASCGFSNLPDSTACTADSDVCTDDICLDGACSHPDNGVCGCGDGDIDPGEECDGQAGVGPHQTCNEFCELEDLTYCGDDIKQSPNDEGTGGPNNDGFEACDGADGVGPHYICLANCELEYVPYCGDGILDAGEQCDGQAGVGPHQTCNLDCTLNNLTYCGDDIKQSPNKEGTGGPLNDGFEECDGADGTPANYICLANCELEYVPFCGDGNLDPGEECDGQSGVGPHQVCEQDCTLTNLTFCGDDIKQSPNDELLGGPLDDGFEECDGADGTPANYICLANCELEYVPFCGDGNIDPGEECDGQAGVGPHQTCESDCTITNLTYCGDDIKQSPNDELLGGPLNDGFEECDGADGTPADYICLVNCELQYVPFCGDGNLDPGEQCDGQTGVGPHQTCEEDCTLTNLTFCGDSVKQSPNDELLGGPLNDGFEACDGADGTPDHYTCLQNCTLEYVPYCGDGILDPQTEECDGQAGVGEHEICNEFCELEDTNYCGDGFTQQPNQEGTGGPLNDGYEQCDGNHSVGPHQVCEDNCALTNLTFCGDDFKQTPNDELLGGPLDDGFEECDGADGTPANYICLANCELEYVPFCGDGNLDPGEECDGQTGVGPHQTCEEDCTLTNLTYCGDDIKQSPNDEGTGGPLNDGFEACDGDDGVGQFQECTLNCELEDTGICGDGVVNRPEEVCDGQDGVPPGYTCSQDCLLDISCEDALAYGYLTGNITDEGTATVENNAPVDFTVSLVSYEMFAALIEDQVMFDADTAIVEGESNHTFAVDIPACAYQIDLVCGEPLMFAPFYGDRIIDFDFENQGDWCIPDITGKYVDLTVDNGFPQERDYSFTCEPTGFTPTAYYWYFGDGDILPNTTLNNVFHTYSDDGNYTVSCIGTDLVTYRSDSLDVEVSESQPPIEQCYDSVQDIPASCSAGAVVQDTWTGCRTVICEDGADSTQILACNKPGNFEMYLQGQSGNSPEVCIGETCLNPFISGFARSDDFPICTGDQPVCTDLDQDGFSIEGNECGLTDCNDANNTIFPGSTETCNQADDNCNTQVDEGGVCDPDPVCGNNVTEAGEQCDDNNTDNGDGCSSTCQIEVDETCYESVETVAVTCSDGILSLDSWAGCRSLECTTVDSGVQVLACNKPGNYLPTHFEMYLQGQWGAPIEVCAGDTCLNPQLSGFAKSDDFPICTGEPPVCTDLDQDGFAIEGGLCGLIDCNDGNSSINTDAAEVCNLVDDNCNTEVDEGGVCDPDPVCGNGDVEAGETCDDGNTESGDGCDSSCQTEGGETCYDTMQDIPAECSVGDLTLDEFAGCRAMICDDGQNGMQVLACNKPGNYLPTHFEMYLQGSWGVPGELCLAGECLNPAVSGFHASSGYPICQ